MNSPTKDTQSSEPSSNTPRRRPKSLDDLKDLLGGLESSSAPPNLQDTAGESTAGQVSQSKASEQRLNLPPGVEEYLPPGLWRKLNGLHVERNVLVNALEQLRSILYILSTYLPGHVVQEKMNHPVPGIVKGSYLTGSLLFSDVSGFTALSEKLEALGPEGAERMTRLMNQYFSAMLEILSWSGGILIKFAGDATLVYFPDQDKGTGAEWAVRAGLRMLRAMPAFADIPTPSGKIGLKMKIGVSTGKFLAASVGDAERMEYVILGDPVMGTMACEGSATAGELVVDKATIEFLNPDFSLREVKKDFYAVTYPEQDLDDFELRADRRRARGAIPWDISPEAAISQMELALKQINSIKPFLPTELIGRIIATQKRRKFESEYRPTTVMFCNFVGLEPLLQIMGDEAPQRVTGLLNAFFINMNQIISSYGGIVSRIDPYKNGSKMLVLFGAPVTHEDDPQRALNAALAMNAELADLNDRWRQRFARLLPDTLKDSPLLQLRIGITQGTTFAGLVGSSSRREYTVMGDQVNLAARLMSAAESGQILISPSIYKDIQDFFITTALASIKVKGKTKPIPIYQVEGPRQDILLKRIQNRTDLVGRDVEFNRGIDLLNQAIQGKSQLLIITGPAGIGKSHLADSIISTGLSSKPRLLFFQAHNYLSTSSYFAWQTLMRSILNITPFDNTVLQEDKFSEFVRNSSMDKKQAQLLSELIEIRLIEKSVSTSDDVDSSTLNISNSLEISRQRTRIIGGVDFWDQLQSKNKTDSEKPSPQIEIGSPKNDPYLPAFLTVFKYLSLSQPVIIFFEDAQYLDTPSRQLIFQINREIGDAKLFILLSQRQEEDTPIHQGCILKLDPLSIETTAALMSLILIKELAPIIQQKTNGNPLLIEQITRWIQQTRKISFRDMENVLQSSDIIQKLILGRLVSLPENQQEVIKAASVIGDEFRSGELQAIQPQIDPSTLSLYIRELIKNQLITLTEMGVDPEYTFQQSLVRDILYNSLPVEQRKQFHNTLAEYLEASGSKQKIQARLATFFSSQATRTSAQSMALIGYHYEQAELWYQAAQKYFLACQEFYKNHNSDKAVEIGLQALSCLEKEMENQADPKVLSLKAEVLARLGTFYFDRSDPYQSINYLESSLSLLSRSETPDLYFRTSFNLALLLPSLSRSSESELILRTLLEGEKECSMCLLASYSWILWRNQSPASSQWISDSLLSNQIHEHPLLHALLLYLSGDFDQAQMKFHQLKQTLGSAIISMNRAQVETEHGQFLQTLDLLTAAEGYFSQSALSAEGIALVSFYRANIYWKQDNLELCRQEIQKASGYLDQSSGKIQKAGRDSIRKATRILESNRGDVWPEWSTIEFLDYFVQSVMFLRE